MQQPTWWNDYVGLLYKEKGRDRSGLDCWGLVRLVLAEQFGIHLPSLSDQYELNDLDSKIEAIARNREGWTSVDVEQSGDVVLFYVLGHPHVGIITTPGRFLHIREGSDSVIESLSSATWKHRVRTIARYTEGKAEISISACPHPLQTMRVDEEMPAGLNLAQMVQLLGAKYGISDALATDGAIAVNGQYIPKEEWERTYPAKGSRIEYRALARGDAGRIIGMIFVIIAVFIFQQYYLAPLVTAGTITAATASFATMALTMAGSMLVNAIFPVRPPKVPDMTPGRSQMLMQGGSNQANPFGAVPVVLGKFRFTPPVGAQNIVDTNTNTSYLRMYLVWGYGPLQITNVTLGEAPIDSYIGIDYQTLTGYEDDAEDKTHFNRIYGSDYSQTAVGTVLECLEASPSGFSRTSGVSTVTFAADHGFTFGMSVTIRDCPDPSFNGRYDIASTPTSKTLTYVQTGKPNATGIGASYSGTIAQAVLKASIGGTIKSYNISTVQVATDGSGYYLRIVTSTAVTLVVGQSIEISDLYLNGALSYLNQTYVIDTIESTTSFLVRVSDSGYLTDPLEGLAGTHSGTYTGTFSATASASNWVSRTTSDDVDSITLTLHFPEGLRVIAIEGGKAGSSSSAPYRAQVQLRQVDSSTGVPITGWGDVESSIIQTPITLQMARDNIDSDADLEDVYQWTRVSVNEHGKVIVRKGCHTNNLNANPTDPLLARLKAQGTGFNINLQYLPGLPEAEEELWRICVKGTKVYSITDYRTAGLYTGLSLKQVAVVGGAVTTLVVNTDVRNYTFYLEAGTLTRSFTDSVRIGSNGQPFYKRKDAFSYNLTFNVNRGRYEIRIRRTNNSSSNYKFPSGNDGQRLSKSILSAVTGRKNARPVAFKKTLARTAINIKATNQLNGNVEGITGTVASICKDWTGSKVISATRAANVVTVVTDLPHTLEVGWAVTIAGNSGGTLNGTFTITQVVDNKTFKFSQVAADGSGTGGTCNAGWVERPTRNCASLYRYVLQHPANAKRVADSKIDLVTLQDWHYFCRKNGFMFGMVITNQMSVDDILRDIAAAGRASPVRLNGKRSVVVDQPRTTIVQHFTPHNSWGFEGTRTLPKLPHAFRVSFFNEQKGYQPDEMIVYADGYSSSNATLFEGLQLPGVTNPTIVYKHTRFHLAQLKLRPETYVLNTDCEHIVCSRGDLVRVTHFVPMWGLATGRIKNFVSTTVLDLDESVPMTANTQYTIRIRCEDGSSVTRTVAAKVADGYYTQITLTSTITSTQGNPGNLFMFGALNSESVELIVHGIEPQANGNARIKLVDYAPEVYNSDSEAIPAFDSQITLPPVLHLPTITAKPTIVYSGVISDERVMTRVAPGVFKYSLRVPFTNPTNLPHAVTHVEAHAVMLGNNSDDWDHFVIVRSSDASVTFDNVEEGEYYRVKMRYVDRNGRTGPWIISTNLFIVGRANPPSVPTGGTAVPTTGGRLFLNWNDNPEADVNRYEVRTDLNWGVNDINRIYYGGSSSCYVDLIAESMAAPGVKTFYVKARDSVLKFSTSYLTITYTVVVPAAPATLAYTIQDTATTAATLTLDWADVDPPFDLKYYELSYGTSVLNIDSSSKAGIPVNWSVGTSRTFTVKTVDKLGNKSTGKTLSVTRTGPGLVASCTQSVLRAGGKISVTLDWPEPTRGLLPIAGYEIRTSNANFGTSGFVYKGLASKCTIANVSTTAQTVWYIRAYDTDGKYSADSLTVIHDNVAPATIASLTVSRVKSSLVLTAASTSKPADFRCYEFRIGQVRVGATTGNNTPDAVPAAGAIWDDPDCLVVQSTDRVVNVPLSSFPTPRYSTTGVVYRAEVRMLDSSGNYSTASASGSVTVKSLS